MALEFGLGVFRQPISVLLRIDLVDLHQLLSRIVRKFEVFAEPGRESRIGFDKVVHEVRIARHDHHQLIPVIFHGLEDRLHCLPAVAVLGVIGQSVGFIHEQNASHGLLDHFLRFQGCLTHITGHQSAPIRFHQLPFRQDADSVIELRHQSGDGGFAGTGVPGEDQVTGDGGDFHPPFLPDLSDFDKVHQAADVLLHALQSYQGVQLRQQALQRFFLLRFHGLYVGEGPGGGAAGSLRIRLIACRTAGDGFIAAGRIRRFIGAEQVIGFRRQRPVGAEEVRSHPAHGLGNGVGSGQYVCDALGKIAAVLPGGHPGEQVHFLRNGNAGIPGASRQELHDLCQSRGLFFREVAVDDGGGDQQFVVIREEIPGQSRAVLLVLFHQLFKKSRQADLFFILREQAHPRDHQIDGVVPAGKECQQVRVVR